MFDSLRTTKKAIPHRVAVWGAIAGAFALGLGTGKILAGVRPWDWTLAILNFTIALFWTIYLAIIASRRDIPADK